MPQLLTAPAKHTSLLLNHPKDRDRLSMHDKGQMCRVLIGTEGAGAEHRQGLSMLGLSA